MTLIALPPGWIFGVLADFDFDTPTGGLTQLAHPVPAVSISGVPWIAGTVKDPSPLLRPVSYAEQYFGILAAPGDAWQTALTNRRAEILKEVEAATASARSLVEDYLTDGVGLTYGKLTLILDDDEGYAEFPVKMAMRHVLTEGGIRGSQAVVTGWKDKLR